MPESITHNEALDMIRRLVAAMQMGVHIECQDGHRWIELTKGERHPFDADENPLMEILKDAGVSLNNKIYGSHRHALKVIDDALLMANAPTLLERYYQRYRDKDKGSEALDDEVFGEPFEDHHRLDGSTPGKGGVY